MEEIVYKISDSAGLHARPAGKLAKKAAEYESTVTVEKDGKRADTRRVMALMSLGIKCGDSIKIIIEGEDEKKASEEIRQFLEEIQL